MRRGRRDPQDPASFPDYEAQSRRPLLPGRRPEAALSATAGHTNETLLPCAYLVAIGLDSDRDAARGCILPGRATPAPFSVKRGTCLNGLTSSRCLPLAGQLLSTSGRPCCRQPRRGQRHHTVLDDQPTLRCRRTPAEELHSHEPATRTDGGKSGRRLHQRSSQGYFA